MIWGNIKACLVSLTSPYSGGLGKGCPYLSFNHPLLNATFLGLLAQLFSKVPKGTIEDPS
jgi:hypothetical protein